MLGCLLDLEKSPEVQEHFILLEISTCISISHCGMWCFDFMFIMNLELHWCVRYCMHACTHCSYVTYVLVDLGVIMLFKMRYIAFLHSLWLCLTSSTLEKQPFSWLYCDCSLFFISIVFLVLQNKLLLLFSYAGSVTNFSATIIICSFLLWSNMPFFPQFYSVMCELQKLEGGICKQMFIWNPSQFIL